MTTREQDAAPAGEGPLEDPSFAAAFEGLRETGATTDTRALVDLLARHGREEGAVLAAYEQLVQSSKDQAVQYLGRLILDDERRHHTILAEIANSLAWETREVPGTPVTPPLPLHLGDELLAATRELRHFEDEDRRELKTLRKRLRPFADTTLWGLLVDLMLLDTEKHSTILRFLEDHADVR